MSKGPRREMPDINMNAAREAFDAGISLSERLEHTGIPSVDAARRLHFDVMKTISSIENQNGWLQQQLDTLEQEHAEVKEAARRDEKTGLLKESAFMEEVEEWREKNPDAYGAMAIFDLDGMKLLNQRFGYERADEVIKTLAAALEAAFRREGEVVARKNEQGDEFLLFLPLNLADNQREEISDQVLQNYVSKTLNRHFAELMEGGQGTKDMGPVTATVVLQGYTPNTDAYELKEALGLKMMAAKEAKYAKATGKE